MKKFLILAFTLITLQTQANTCSVYLFDGVHFPEKLQNLISNVLFINSHPRQQDKDLMDLFTQYKDQISFKQSLKIIKSISTPKLKQKIIKSYYFSNRNTISTKQIKSLFKNLPEGRSYFNSSLKLVRLISNDHLSVSHSSKAAQNLYNRSLSIINISDLEWRMFVLSQW